MDQDGPNLDPRGGAAARLWANVDRIIAIWEERLRAEIPAAAREPTPVLVDTLPEYLRLLAEALSPDHPRHTGSEGNSIGEEHGSLRVRVTGYRLDDVIREYQLLREVLEEVLEVGGPLSPGERRTILISIDRAVREACSAYLLLESQLREQVSATLSHDLRGPLTAARSAAELILRKPDSPNLARWASRVVDSVDRADSMLQDVLDASRLRAGGRLPLTLTELELGELISDVVDQLRTVHGDRFVLRVHDRVRGYWSEQGLRRAVENLAVNAVRYGSPVEVITIEVREQTGRVQLSVHNHGSYIPAEQRELLFEAFARTTFGERSGHRGWGLGLAAVRGIAESHGGSITVDSLPDTGTTFLVNLPIDARPFSASPTTLPART